VINKLTVWQHADYRSKSAVDLLRLLVCRVVQPRATYCAMKLVKTQSAKGTMENVQTLPAAEG